MNFKRLIGYVGEIVIGKEVAVENKAILITGARSLGLAGSFLPKVDNSFLE